MFPVFVCHDKDFSRNRSLDFIKTITTIFGFQGKTLDKELIDIGKPVTASALVQRRGKILPEAFYYLFRSYAERAFLSARNMMATDL